MRMYARKQLDISAEQLAFALSTSRCEGGESQLERAVAKRWSDDATIALSVRSAFDAWLTAAALPAGSRVLMSSVTIPHMPELVRLHGLTPVPLDLDPDTMTVSASTLGRALDDSDGRVRAVVIVHPFGALHPLSPLVEPCRAAGVTLIEDGAQAYDGAGWRGEPEADVSLVSFGPIKTATALGGAIIRVRDPAIRSAVREVMAGWPLERRRARAARVLRWIGLAAVSHPRLYGGLVRAMRVRGIDHDAWLRTNVRGFSEGAGLLEQIRNRPSAGLLHVLARRLDEADGAAVRQRAEVAARLSSRFGPHVHHLGHRAARHTHWLFPIASRDPSALIAEVREAGFDATDGTSTLIAMPGAPRAEEAMRGVVYLPVYATLPDDALDRLAEAIDRAERPDSRAPNPRRPRRARARLAQQ